MSGGAGRGVVFDDEKGTFILSKHSGESWLRGQRQLCSGRMDSSSRASWTSHRGFSQAVLARDPAQGARHCESGDGSRSGLLLGLDVELPGSSDIEGEDVNEGEYFQRERES